MDSRELESRPDTGRVGGKLLEHRDMMALKWLGEQYAGRADHLEKLIDRNSGTVHRMVERLRDAGYVRTRQILVGERMWVMPTKAGLRACGLPYPALLPRSMSLAHIAAVGDVRLHVQPQRPDGVWVCERQVMIDHPRTGHLPDALFLLEGRQMAIEVELSARATGRVTAKLDQLCKRFDAAMYYCAPAPHRKLSALEKSGRWPKLAVRELPGGEARRP